MVKRRLSTKNSEEQGREAAEEEFREADADADADGVAAGGSVASGVFLPQQGDQRNPVSSVEGQLVLAADALEAASTDPKPRLMIQRVVLENFKSYGGRRVIGPFHKSFSSIVGPNGSGKSNVIDALLFVFGKRAKKMRLSKVSDLIHTSSTLPNLPSARVEVTFQDIVDTGDGETDYRVVDGSVLTVGREAMRNNQSKYTLDGKTSNFTEVTSVLRTRGVDLEHNRFLILQGEVELISQMKPKAQSQHDEGFLEYLEDIIGSNQYVEPIQEAEKSLEFLTEQRQQKLGRLQVAEREKTALEGPCKEAEEWVCSEAERLELNTLLFQTKASQDYALRAVVEDEYKALQEGAREFQAKMLAFETKIKSVEKEHNKHFDAYKKLQTDLHKGEADFKELERQDVQLAEDVTFNEEKVLKQRRHAQAEEERSQQLAADAEHLRRAAPKREAELQSAERHRESLEKKLEKIYLLHKEKCRELQVEKEQREVELVPLQQKLTGVTETVSVAETEANFIKQKQAQAAQLKESLTRTIEEQVQLLSNREAEKKKISVTKNDRIKLIKEAKGKVQQLSQQVDQLYREVSEAFAKAEETKREFEQERTRGALIREVYEAKRNGTLEGIHGRLGDLGTIASKYDVAVSTSCGLLDAIVVETTTDAQRVIEFVRRHDLGRTTCIALNVIQEWSRQMEAACSPPEGVPRLFDQIKATKPEFRVAFYFALRDTLVAKDLTQATRVGFGGRQRYKVVTLDGKLLDTSGTMTGGGHQVQKGGMKASLCQFSPEEVKVIQKDYESKRAELESARKEKATLESAVSEAEKEVAELELMGSKCAMDCASLQKEITTNEAQLAQVSIPQLSKDDKTRLKELDRLIASHRDELQRLSEAHRAKELEVKELHNQIMDIGGDELKQARAKVEEAKKKCEDMSRNIKKALVDADNMIKNSQVALTNAAAADQERQAAELKLVSLKEEQAKLEDRAASLMKECDSLKVRMLEKDGVLKELSTKREEVLAAALELKHKEFECANAMEAKARELKELHASVLASVEKVKAAREDYAQLPLEILRELRTPKAGDPDAEPERPASDLGVTLSRRAIEVDLPPEDLQEVACLDVEARVLTLEARIKDLRPNLTAIADFRKASAEHQSKLEGYELVHGQREEVRRKLEGLRQTRLESFMSAFTVISVKLKEMYQMITLGGDAELELADALDPFSEGITFSVRPPKKSWKQIVNLSGGEKTLASLSLVFALHHYKPTPLYFMDEIDAALDFRNVSIIANYIKERTKGAQFIVISLRNHMFEMADLLVGIYKTEDISKSVGICPGFFLCKPPEVAKLNPICVESTG